MVDFRGAGAEKGVGVEVEGAGLVGGLEDVGDVEEEDVEEEVGEEGAEDAAFGVVAFESLGAVIAEGEFFDGAFVGAAGVGVGAVCFVFV